MNQQSQKHHLADERLRTCKILWTKPLKTSFFLQTTASIIAFCSSFKRKSLSFPAFRNADSKALASSSGLLGMRPVDHIARFWLRVRGVSQSSSVAHPTQKKTKSSGVENVLRNAAGKMVQIYMASILILFVFFLLQYVYDYALISHPYIVCKSSSKRVCLLKNR